MKTLSWEESIFVWKGEKTGRMAQKLTFDVFNRSLFGLASGLFRHAFKELQK
jgi:hypothetical protein